MGRISVSARKNGVMINGKMILGIIPARGGSKGILGKNAKEIAGKPLIAWTVEAAKQSKYIDRLIISTDSEEIAGIGRDVGVEIPFLRPSEIAQDKSTGADVILHTLNWFEGNDLKFDYFIYLQPTSPMRKSIHIDKAIEMIVLNGNADSLVSISESSKHPHWMKTINKNGYIENFLPSGTVYNNRQDLSAVYALNGAIYICRWDVFVEDHSFYLRNCLPFVMDQVSSIDIDINSDWEYAEYILSNNLESIDI